MQILCGVDVSKDWLDSFIPPSHFERFENCPEGIGRLADFIRIHAASLVVMESSGGVERLPFYMLWSSKSPVPSLIHAACGILPRRWGIWKKLIASMPG